MKIKRSTILMLAAAGAAIYWWRQRQAAEISAARAPVGPCPAGYTLLNGVCVPLTPIVG